MGLTYDHFQFNYAESIRLLLVISPTHKNIPYKHVIEVKKKRADKENTRTYSLSNPALLT